MAVESMAALALALSAIAIGFSAVTLIVVSQTHALNEDERQHRPTAANGNTPSPEVYDDSASVGGR